MAAVTVHQPLLSTAADDTEVLGRSLGINHYEYEVQNNNKPRSYGTTAHGYVPDTPLLEAGGVMRYVMPLLVFFGFFFTYAGQNAMIVAIVAMVNSTSAQVHDNDTQHSCPAIHPSNTTTPTLTPKHGDFNWSFGDQSLVISITFFGSLFTMLPSGLLSERFGGKLVLGISVVATNILTVTTPLVAGWGVYWLIASRFLAGFFQGPMMPAASCLWGRWAPPLERSKILAIANSGSIVAIMVSIGLTGYLCSLEFLGGWPLPFYLFGGLGCIWFLLWMVIASNGPSDNRWISSVEKVYIESSLGHTRHGSTSYRMAPWKSIITSLPVIAMSLSHLLALIGFVAIYMSTPVYMDKVLKFNMTSNGLLLALPHVAVLIGSIFSGWLCDIVLKQKWFSVTITRKLFALIGGTMKVLLLVGMGLAVCDPVLAVLFLVLAWGLGSIDTVGVSISSIDIAPQYAGTVMSLTSTFISVGGIIAQTLTNIITHGQGNPSDWQKLFFTSAGMYAGGLLLYLLFGTSERQPWAIPKDENASLTLVVDESKPLVDHNQNMSY